MGLGVDNLMGLVGKVKGLPSATKLLSLRRLTGSCAGPVSGTSKHLSSQNAGLASKSNALSCVASCCHMLGLQNPSVPPHMKAELAAVAAAHVFT